MNSPGRPSTIAVFSDLVHAEAAVAELRDRGFTEDQIGIIVVQHGQSPHRSIPFRQAQAEEAVAQSEITREGKGSLSPSAGAGLGALAGIGVAALSLSLFGPVLAGGALAVLLANSVAGGAFAGFFSTLIDWGIAEEEAHTLEDELAAGRTIVTIHANGRDDEALAILKRHRAFDPRRPSVTN